MDPYIQDFIFKYINPQTHLGIIIFAVILVWSLFWKSLGLWKSARNDERVWFVAILLLNTIGILEIAYLFFIAREKLTIEKARINIKSYKFQNPLNK